MATVQQTKVEVIYDKAFNSLSMLGAARLPFLFSNLTLLLMISSNLPIFGHGLTFALTDQRKV